MIPLRDNIPSSKPAVVTWALIALNAAAFAYQLWLSDAANAAFIRAWGVRPIEYWHLDRYLDELPLGVVAPLFTSLFLHGGWSHLLGNMVFLWIFGDNVEDRLGRALYGLLYLAFGLTATAAHVLLSGDSPTPTIGASGAISGVLGAYLVFYPRAQVLTLVPIFIIASLQELPALLFLGVWFLMQLIPGFLSLGDGAGGGVAWWAHVGGFVAGAAAALVWRALVPAPNEAQAPRRHLAP